MCFFLLSALALALGASGAALADPPTLSLEQQGTLETAGMAVAVTTEVNCGDGATDGTVLVNVRQGNVLGTGVMPFTSTGTRQQVVVNVVGPFIVGDSIALAELICGALPEGLLLGVRLTIIAP